ncbi:hypothetical protein MesoLjLb_33040 [Mesorhizobium sp. L-8-3]|nr:hypothetical protein MesoLjLb_33040 [Mesorhizobium sp. L-8-3]
MDLFLREELDKHLNFYAGGDDPFPIAAFKLIEGAQAEGWLSELVSKAYEARPKNRKIADIAKAIGIEIDISALEPAGPVRREPPLWQILNPYRGLQVVREQDANFLFGRDDDIARFIATLAENPSKLFLAFGASGVGKSSLIFGGIFAALDRQSLRGGRPWPAQLSQSRTWPRLSLAPGPEPLRSLAGAFLSQWLDPKEAKFREETNSWRELLLKGDSLDGLVEALDAFLLQKRGDRPPRYLLYIDQGEELYTRGGREPGHDNTAKETQAQKEARRFSEILADAARHPRLVAIMSARSDFLGRLQADAPLHAIKQQIDIAPLSPEGLSEVVRRPAKALDVAFEPGLDEALIEATRAQPGGLPLLSDTLGILWKEMQARGKPILVWSRPLKKGVDVALKLGERADGFVKARASEEALLRRLFCVRLAYVPLQGEATRRTALLDELTEPERAFVAELAGPEQRIVVTGERDGRATAEVAHEALFTGWRKLRDWIVSRRAFYAWITLNENDRKDWEHQGKVSSALLTGRPLERARSFLEIDGEDIPTSDRAFIEASIKADEEARRVAAEEQRKKVDALKALAEEQKRRAEAESQRAAEQQRVAEIQKKLAIEASWRADAQRKQADEARHRARVTRRELVAVSIAAFLAVLGAVYGYWQANLAEDARVDAVAAAEEANRQRGEADRQKAEAEAKATKAKLNETISLAALSHVAESEGSPVAAIKLALAAWPRRGDEGRPALLRTINSLDLAFQDFGQSLLLRGHKGSVGSGMFSADGSRILTASSDHTARVWDAATGEQLMLLKGHEDRVSSAAFSPDGTRVVTASNDRTARVWDAITGDQVALLKGHEDRVLSAAFSPDGRRVVTAADDKTPRVWDAATGAQLAVMKGHEGYVRSAAFSSDGSRIVTAADDKTARVWDAVTGEQLALLKGHADTVWSAAFSPDGRRIVTAADDKTARVWDAVTGDQVALLKGHESSVSSAAFSPNGTRVVTGSWDDTARVWNAATGAQLALMKGHKKALRSAAFSPDGKRIITASWDNTGRVWDSATGTQLALMKGHQNIVRSAAFSPDGKRIITVSGDETARVWDAATGTQLTVHDSGGWSAAFSPDGARIVTTASTDNGAWVLETATGVQLAALKGHDDWISSAAFSPDGRRIVTASDDKTARVWDAVTGDQVALLKGHEDRVSSAAFSPDGTRVVTASNDRTARVWDAITGDQVALLKGHEDTVASAAFSLDGSRIVTASDDKTARVWEAVTGDQVALLKGHESSVSSAAFSPAGTRIITASNDETARVWDATTGAQLVLLEGFEYNVTSAAFSPNETWIVMPAFANSTAVVWDVGTGDQLTMLIGHTDIIKSAVFSPDGTRIATSSYDHTARIWDTATGAQLAALSGHMGPVNIAVFSPDGTRVLTASSDSTARVWDTALPTGDAFQVACAWLGNDTGLSDVQRRYGLDKLPPICGDRPPMPVDQANLQ